MENTEKSTDKKADKNTDKNVHKHHRQRVRRRYYEEGLEGFEDHQALELLLFYSIPQGDTNPLAHRLLDEFGSLAAVLEADWFDLLQVKGVGEQTACLLTMMPELFGRYQKSKCGDRLYLNNSKDLGRYALSLVVGEPRERFYLVCMDVHNRVNHTTMLCEGTLCEVGVYPRTVVEEAIRRQAKNVVLIHNHPSGNLTPSNQDMELTHVLENVLDALAISVLDHIIVGHHRYFSFTDNGLIKNKFGG